MPSPIPLHVRSSSLSYSEDDLADQRVMLLEQQLRLAAEADARFARYHPHLAGQMLRSAENFARAVMKMRLRPIQNEENIAVPSQQDCPEQLLEVIARINLGSDANSPARTICTPRPGITNWEMGDSIAKGSFASVYRGYSNEDKLFFAAKGVSLNDHKHLPHLENEIAILKRLYHENIIQYYGAERDEEMLYIFLELVSHGTLEQAYKNFCFNESQVSDYTRQILQGLGYLHSCKVVHGDLKCANILVTESGRVILADFGFSRSMEDHSQSLKLGLGSSFWMAPEVAKRKRDGYGYPSDIWSLGCTVTELSTRKYPGYNADNAVAVDRAIRSGKGPIVPDYLSDTLKDFINQCLQTDPNQRPTAADLLAHPFVNESS
ncbi:hypothetical protein SADUNF_Sadunf17G0016500 [Salix dunnii]|uniref:Protein kinase domain-containing protein n=1 Tax=Salix dunnii TaxID=1413687 RepID=A0A835MGX9_9ROSI|nr:hypothetical protein SADUNF_Sadunf17G0016500 [Salix dunnii]